MHKQSRTVLATLLIASLAISMPTLARVTIEDGHKAPNKDYRSANDSLRVGSDVEVGDLSATNGAIRIGDNSVMKEVSSVNGSVQMGNNSHARSVDSVNGGIKMGEYTTVERNVESVNGSIQLRGNGEIGGDVSTVNGGISLKSTRVGGNVETYNGDIELEAGTEVMGDLMVHKSKGKSWRKPDANEIYIGADVVIHGDLYFEKDVELHVDPSARIGKIIGSEFVEGGLK